MRGGQGLAIGFEGGRVHAVGARLLFFRQFGDALQARVGQGGQGSLGLVAAHGQLGTEGAGEHLLGRLEGVQRHLLEDACGAWEILLLVGQVGGAQAQQGGVFRGLAGSGLFEQLLDAGVRGAWQFAQAG
ncbi:hypothetical protein D3C85_1581200 [compost metagenome]